MSINHSVILLFECQVCLCHSGSVSKELQWHPVAVKLKFKFTNHGNETIPPGPSEFLSGTLLHGRRAGEHLHLKQELPWCCHKKSQDKLKLLFLKSQAFWKGGQASFHTIYLELQNLKIFNPDAFSIHTDNITFRIYRLLIRKHLPCNLMSLLITSISPLHSLHIKHRRSLFSQRISPLLN